MDFLTVAPALLQLKEVTPEGKIIVQIVYNEPCFECFAD